MSPQSRRPMATVIDKYLQKISEATSKPGVYAYRGQSRAEWRLHSAATRRLAASLTDRVLEDPRFSKIYTDYHREALVDAARTRGFGVESGRDISDLQLVAKLQHFGAATGLLDFTWSPLIALWFAASRDSDSEGKLFVLNVNNPVHIAKAPSDPENQSIDNVFSPSDNTLGLLYWEPMWIGDATPRILRQRGLFIIGRPLVPMNSPIIGEIMISKDDKISLIKELAVLDISDSSLFPDLYGFSASEGVNVSISMQNRNSQFYFVQGNQYYQAGNYELAIAAYSNVLDMSPGVAEVYFLRAGAKFESKLYREAVDDYRQAIEYIGHPFMDLAPEQNFFQDVMLFIAYFNCANVLAELRDYEDALSNYSQAIQLQESDVFDQPQTYFNRGNTYLDLGQFDAAINDYDAALSLKATADTSGMILFNKGNALVATGDFEKALECYQQAAQQASNLTGVANNRVHLERIMSVIGHRQSRCSFELSLDFALSSLTVYVTGVDMSHLEIGHRNPVFQGRVGNAANFGLKGQARGKGFDEKVGFAVRVVSENLDGGPTSGLHES